jgi:hypothetical protein
MSKMEKSVVPHPAAEQSSVVMLPYEQSLNESYPFELRCLLELCLLVHETTTTCIFHPIQPDYAPQHLE